MPFCTTNDHLTETGSGHTYRKHSKRDAFFAVLNGQAVAETAPYKHGDTVTWFLRDQPGYLKKPAVEEELTAALTAWAPACGLVFEKAKVEAGAKIVFGFHGQDGDATYIFDGPGGCLAQVVRAAEKGAGDGNGPAFIKFDEEEKWLLQGDAAAFGAFRLLPVAIHEVRESIRNNAIYNIVT